MMTFAPLMAFGVGWLAALIGTLPFGPINLSVVETTINKGLRDSIWLAAAAALVEILQSAIALHCSLWLGEALTNNIWIKAAGFLVFMILGLIFMLKKERPSGPAAARSGNNFIKGLVIALLNPQALPFWIFVLTYLNSSHIIELNATQPWSYIILFLLGVSIGKFIALLLFGIASRAICRHSDLLRQSMNKIIGGILLLIGLYQGLSAFLS